MSQPVPKKTVLIPKKVLVTVPAPKLSKPTPVAPAPKPTPVAPAPAPAAQPIKKERKKVVRAELTLKQKIVAFLQENHEPCSNKSLNSLIEIYSQKYPDFFLSLGIDPTIPANLQSKEPIEGFDPSLDHDEIPGGATELEEREMPAESDESDDGYSETYISQKTGRAITITYHY